MLELVSFEVEVVNVMKSIFFVNMSYELRIFLNVIIGYSEMLIEEVEDLDLEELVLDLDKILCFGKLLLVLINDLLDIFKIEVGKMEFYLEIFNFKELIVGIFDIISFLFKNNNNKLEVEIFLEFEEVYGDLIKLW